VLVNKIYNGLAIMMMSDQCNIDGLVINLLDRVKIGSVEPVHFWFVLHMYS